MASVHSNRNELKPFHFGRNEETIPAGMKCNVHSNRNEMRPFHFERNEETIPDRMK
jgi:hypothetical protein